MDKHEFDIEMKVPDMFAFMLRQQYGGIRGLAFLLVDLALIVSLIIKWDSLETGPKLIMIILALVLTVVEPLQLLVKAKAQVKLSERFKASTHYAVDSEGMTVSQGEQSMELKWGHLFKYVNAAKRLYIYTSRASAFVLPKEVMGKETTDFLLGRLSEHKADFLTLPLDSIKICGPENMTEQADDEQQKGQE